MNKYGVIITGATDNNRGDEALNWKAQELLETQYGIKDVYVLQFGSEQLEQSIKNGLIPIKPILSHPSEHTVKYHSNNSITYLFITKVLWGIYAVIDWIKSSLLLHPLFRVLGINFLNEEQKKTLEIIKKADITIVKGGGFIHSYGKLTDIYYIYYILYHIRLSLAFDKKVIILPNSFGPFDGIGIKKRIANVLNKCTYISCRESLSQTMLRNIGVETRVHHDMAFSLLAKESESALLTVENVLSEKKNIAITVRPYRFPEEKDPMSVYSSYKNAFVILINWLLENNFNPVFIEHTFSSSNHENDYICIQEIEELLEKKINVISNHSLNCKEMKYIYSRFDYVVGTRFHSVIFSLSEGVPCIAISYSGNKAVGIMNDIGLDRYVLNANTLTGKQLIEAFLEMFHNSQKYKGNLLKLKSIILQDSKDLKAEINKKIYLV